MLTASHTPIPGSAVIHLPGVRPADSTRRRGPRMRVTVVLKSSPLPVGHRTARKVKRILASRPHGRPRLAQRELADLQCAERAHVAAVRRFARTFGLEVV